jgi:hypothetical protein
LASGYVSPLLEKEIDAHMIEWSCAFDAPIYLHEANRPWVMRPDKAVEFWQGEIKTLWAGMSHTRRRGGLCRFSW